MPVAYVQDTGYFSVQGGTGAATGSFATTPTVGNTMIATVSTFEDVVAAHAVRYTDNNGNDWVEDMTNAAPDPNPSYSRIARAFIRKTASRLTVSIDVIGTGVSQISACVAEFSGVRSESPLDRTATNGTAGSATSITAGPTSALSQNQEVAISTLARSGAPVNYAATACAGFTLLFAQNDITFQPGAGAYNIVTTGVAQTAAWTWTTGTNVYQVTSLATYRAGPAITQQPARFIVDASASITFSVTAIAAGGTLTYQWQELLSGTWTNIVGQTSTSLVRTAPSSPGGASYRCVVTDSDGTTTSDVGMVIVLTDNLRSPWGAKT